MTAAIRRRRRASRIATPISQIELASGSAIRIGGLTWEGIVGSAHAY